MIVKNKTNKESQQYNKFKLWVKNLHFTKRPNRRELWLMLISFNKGVRTQCTQRVTGPKRSTLRKSA